MLFLLSILIISKNITTVHVEDQSSMKAFAVDSVLCYAAYTAALAALTTAAGKLERSSFPIFKDSPEEELTIFSTSCANKYSATTCKTVVDAQITKVTEDGPTSFTTNCKINEPKTDATDCYTAYSALVAALEKLEPIGSRKIQMKAAVNELDAFVTKCPKTSHSTDCLPILSPIRPDVGPVYTDLENIQKKCELKASPPAGGGGSGDHGVPIFSTRFFFLLIVSVIINLYFII
jgi:hypothetical protein